MGNIIKLLPDHVANQIAAGEVIQRPGSVVKELLENAIDAGATEITIHIKDAGKSLIQIIDNGVGMTETDARMCLERHATSKINQANDLFAIKTFGFRGEAMASIAAVAHLEMKTKPHQADLGTHLIVEGSQITKQEPCNTPAGTSMSVKNLFYNIPARRKFLKSDNAEFRNIIDEFQRVAIPNYNIGFKFFHNNSELFRLPAGTFRQRIVGIFGKSMNQKLVPAEEDTTLVNITGFVGKPEMSKKTRGEQFLFVNHRYIKSNYFNHAIQLAYEKLIPEGYNPSYFINFQIDPKVIDVNIHPTKTEVKFETEKDIFVILRTTVKKALGLHNMVPSLDFSSDIQFSAPPKNRDEVDVPGVIVNPDFNPFKNSSNNFTSKSSIQGWESLFTENEKMHPFNTEQEIYNQSSQTVSSQINLEPEIAAEEQKSFTQFQNKYIVTSIKSGIIIVHQQRAHERILFERYLKALENGKSFSQQQLFPITVDFGSYDTQLIFELKEDLKLLGFDIEQFGKSTFVIHGMPTEANNTDPKPLIENLIEQYKINRDKLTLDKNQNLAVSLARNTSIKVGRKLTSQEMLNLIDELFACEIPFHTPSGKPIVSTLTLAELEKRFE